MNRIYELQFLSALLLTLAIEIPCLLLCIRLLLKLDYRSASLLKILAAGFLASFATLPYVWFILPAFLQSYLVYTLVAEAAVFLLEALLYTGLLKISFRRGALLSLLCNGASFAGGEIIKILGK